MMSPNQKSENGDRHAGESHELIAEDLFTGVSGNQLTYHTHGRQHHDIDGGMRIEPKQMLKQHWIATQRRIKNAQVKAALQRHQQQRDCNYRSSKYLNHAG